MENNDDDDKRQNKYKYFFWGFLNDFVVNFINLINLLFLNSLTLICYVSE